MKNQSHAPSCVNCSLLQRQAERSEHHTEFYTVLLHRSYDKYNELEQEYIKCRDAFLSSESFIDSFVSDEFLNRRHEISEERVHREIGEQEK